MVFQVSLPFEGFVQPLNVEKDKHRSRWTRARTLIEKRRVWRMLQTLWWVESVVVRHMIPLIPRYCTTCCWFDVLTRLKTPVPTSQPNEAATHSTGILRQRYPLGEHSEADF